MLDHYQAQVRLLLSVLPDIARETEFALKGGTAINLFYRNLPRLSVDLDLIWLPVEDRRSTLRNIDHALDRIVAAIVARANPGTPHARGRRRQHSRHGQARAGAGEDRNLPGRARHSLSTAADADVRSGDRALRVLRGQCRGLG